MLLAKLLFFTGVLVISQAKVARWKSDYEDVENLNSMEEARSNIELPLDMDDLREDERVVNTFEVEADRRAENDPQTENDRRTAVRIPDELIHLLKNAKSFSEAKRILNSQLMKRGDMLKKRGYAISVTASIQCPVPRYSTVNTVYVSPNTPATPLYNIALKCEPRLATVKLNPPSNAFYYPAFINLHRCAGSCGYVDPSVRQCEVSAQEEIKYSVYKIGHNNFGYADIKVMNHTGCACDCVIKEHHCPPDKMRYNKDICRCECIYDESSCDTSIKKWNPSHCQCECKFAQVQCGVNKVWSTKTCACQ